MPFRSMKQLKWMFANHPKMAKRWAKETPEMKGLPRYVGQRKGKARRRDVRQDHRD